MNKPVLSRALFQLFERSFVAKAKIYRSGKGGDEISSRGDEIRAIDLGVRKTQLN